VFAFPNEGAREAHARYLQMAAQGVRAAKKKDAARTPSNRIGVQLFRSRDRKWVQNCLMNGDEWTQFVLPMERALASVVTFSSQPRRVQMRFRSSQLLPLPDHIIATRICR
jgi:hypothetical protein